MMRAADLVVFVGVFVRDHAVESDEVVDKPAAVFVPGDRSQRQNVINHRDIHHAVGAISRVTVLQPVAAHRDVGGEAARIGLVRNQPHRSGHGTGTKQRALRPFENFHTRQIVGADVRRSPPAVLKVLTGNDGLVEINADGAGTRGLDPTDDGLQIADGGLGELQRRLDASYIVKGAKFVILDEIAGHGFDACGNILNRYSATFRRCDDYLFYGLGVDRTDTHQKDQPESRQPLRRTHHMSSQHVLAAGSAITAPAFSVAWLLLIIDYSAFTPMQQTLVPVSPLSQSVRHGNR